MPGIANLHEHAQSAEPTIFRIINQVPTYRTVLTTSCPPEHWFHLVDIILNAKVNHISTPLDIPYIFKMTMLTKREKSPTKAQNLPSQHPLAVAVKLLSHAAPLGQAPPQGWQLLHQSLSKRTGLAGEGGRAGNPSPSHHSTVRQLPLQEVLCCTGHTLSKYS